MQRADDLFHVYTVDQHTLFVVRNLRRFAYGKYQERFPHARLVFKRIARPELLYLAAIFHDIAKGRGGDHSELGAADAAQFCAQLDIEPAEREMVAWLVRHHLLMSQTAQRKDLSDPVNIQQFAEAVGNTRYLDHLYLLTVADIAGTSPKLWNNWKNKLLWELYLATGDALRRGLENPIKRATRARETRSAALSRLLRRGADPERINALWETLPEYAFWRLSPDQLEWTTEVVVGDPAAERHISVRPVQPHGGSELLVCVPDHDGLFAAITSVLDEMALDVMSARVLTTNDGRSYDLFQLMDQHGEPKPYVLVDTAGIRKRGKIEPGIERYSVMRAMRALDRADVAVLIVDAVDGVTEQDTHVAGLLQDARCGALIAVNKWDLVTKDDHTAIEFTRRVRSELKFLAYAPVLFLSALTGQRASKVLSLAAEIQEQRVRRIPTAEMNRLLGDLTARHDLRRKGRPLRIRYITQVGVAPPRFVLFVSDRELVHFSYERFIENQIRERYGFVGTPLQLSFREGGRSSARER